MKVLGSPADRAAAENASRGFDSIVQTVSGMAYAQSGGLPPEGKPQLMPVSANDYVGGYLMAFCAEGRLIRLHN